MGDKEESQARHGLSIAEPTIQVHVNQPTATTGTLRYPPIHLQVPPLSDGNRQNYARALTSAL